MATNPTVKDETLSDLRMEFEWLVYAATPEELRARFELGANEDPSDYVENRAGNMVADVMTLTGCDAEKAERFLKGYND